MGSANFVLPGAKIFIYLFIYLIIYKIHLNVWCVGWGRGELGCEVQVVPAKAIFGKINTWSRGLVVTGRQVDR